MFVDHMPQQLPDFYIFMNRKKLTASEDYSIAEEFPSSSTTVQAHQEQIEKANTLVERPRSNYRRYIELANPDYAPTNYDILCGRGRGSFLHEGNKMYLALLRKNVAPYLSVAKRVQKNGVVRSIVSALTGHGFRFIKQEESTQMWYELNESEAYDRTAHAIRDIIRKQKMKNKKSPPTKSNPSTDTLASTMASVLESSSKALSAAVPAILADAADDSTKTPRATLPQNVDDRTSPQPMDPIANSVQSIQTQISGSSPEKKTSPSFDIFFELNSSDFGQILQEVDEEKSEKKKPAPEGEGPTQC